MNAIQANLPCECGGSVVATAGDAGGFVNCRCGRSVAVPNLSRLRVLSGKDAYVTNPVDAISKAQRAGQSPAGENCVLCGVQSPVHYRCDATCESPHLKGATSAGAGVLGWLAFFSSLVFVGIGFILRQSGDSEGVVHGHDVGVTFDLPVCNACAATHGNPTRASIAKDLMRRVPAYEKLLEHYPDLTLKVKRASS